jgi:hypothetical protein
LFWILETLLHFSCQSALLISADDLYLAGGTAFSHLVLAAIEQYFEGTHISLSLAFHISSAGLAVLLA